MPSVKNLQLNLDDLKIFLKKIDERLEELSALSSIILKKIPQDIRNFHHFTNVENKFTDIINIIQNNNDYMKQSLYKNISEDLNVIYKFEYNLYYEYAQKIIEKIVENIKNLYNIKLQTDIDLKNEVFKKQLEEAKNIAEQNPDSKKFELNPNQTQQFHTMIAILFLKEPNANLSVKSIR